MDVQNGIFFFGQERFEDPNPPSFQVVDDSVTALLLLQIRFL